MRRRPYVFFFCVIFSVSLIGMRRNATTAAAFAVVFPTTMATTVRRAVVTRATTHGPTQEASRRPYDLPSVPCVCGATGDATRGMPIGNGDAAALVWCVSPQDSSASTTVHILMSKSDAYDENHNLLKVGSVAVTVPYSLTGTCQLHIANASVVMMSDESECRVSVAVGRNNTAVVDMVGCGDVAVAAYGLRKTRRPIYNQWARAYCGEKFISPDIVTSNGDGGVIAWEHRNGNDTMVGHSMRSQGNLTGDNDPLSGHVFGAVVTCVPGCSKTGHLTMRGVMTREVRVWYVGKGGGRAVDWADFWSRSWFHTSQTSVDAAYTHQRYLTGLQSLGRFPVKFNGGLFTLGDDRRWGGLYWWQNTRLAYLPALHTGDPLDSLYNMYEGSLDLATDRCRVFFNITHCAFYVETASVAGTMADGGWGYGCPEQRKGLPPWVAHNAFTRHEHQMGLELLHMMKDHLEFHPHNTILRTRYDRMATPILNFYRLRYPRDGATGRVRISPANGLETYQDGVVDPLPEVAALRVLVHGDDVSWVPELTITNGILQPAKKFGERKNQENVALYAVHPYRLHLRGIGVSVAVAEETYKKRPYKCNVGWCQDILDAALLGLSQEVERLALGRATALLPGRQYPFFSPAFHDEAPNMEHLSVMAAALQFAVLRWSGNGNGSYAIELLAAWPCAWDLHAKFFAPNNTVVEVGYSPDRGGVWRLEVTPPARRKDVAVMRCV